MEIFIISFVVYLMTAFSIGIGMLFRGQSMHAGCRGLAEKSSCKYQSICSGQCRWVK